MTTGTLQRERTFCTAGRAPLTLLALVVTLVMMPGKQVTAQDAGALLRQQMSSPPQQLRSGQEAPVTKQRQAAQPQPRSSAGDSQVRLSDIRFMTMGPDNALYDEAFFLQGLDEFVADKKGRFFTLPELQGLADAVTNMLRQQGHLLDFAWLPEQEITDGRLTINIFRGEMDDPALVVEHVGVEPRVPEPLIVDHLQIKPGDRLLLQDLESLVLKVNDLPGLNISTVIGPGDAPGKSRLLVKAVGEPLLAGAVGVNNHGSRNVGAEQALASLQLRSPLRLGDNLDLSLLFSEGIRYASADWSAPLGVSGARASLAASILNYKYISGLGQTLGYEGDAQRVTVGYRRPFVRSRLGDVYFNIDLSNNELSDDAAAGNLRKRKLNALSLGFSTRLASGSGLTHAGLAFTTGKLDLSGNPRDEAADRGNYRTAGDYRKLTANVRRLQPLSQKLSLYLQMRAQRAGDNLDSSEQFSLGGPNGVRAYPVSEGSGDSGWLASIEARYRLPALGSLGAPQLIAFLDGGGLRRRQYTHGLPTDTASGRNSYGLSGWGVGLNLVKPGRYQFTLTVARRIGANPGRNDNGQDTDGSKDKWRVYTTLMAPL